MRLLKDLKYARERGVNIKDLLEDLKAERSENILKKTCIKVDLLKY